MDHIETQTPAGDDVKFSSAAMCDWSAFQCLSAALQCFQIRLQLDNTSSQSLRSTD